MTKWFNLLMCAYGAVICKLWSAIENIVVWSKNQKHGIFTLNLTGITTISHETGTNYDFTHTTDFVVLLNSGHEFIRLLSFASLRWESVTMSPISSTSWSALSPTFSPVENARWVKIFHHCQIIITIVIVVSTTRAQGGRLWLSSLLSSASWVLSTPAAMTLIIFLMAIGASVTVSLNSIWV